MDRIAVYQVKSGSKTGSRGIPPAGGEQQRKKNLNKSGMQKRTQALAAQQKVNLPAHSLPLIIPFDPAGLPPPGGPSQSCSQDEAA